MKTIRKGYKQTDIGIIPEDWEVVSLSSLGTFYKGKGIPKSAANSGNIGAIRYGELYTDFNNYIINPKTYISIDVAKNAKKIQGGDILFAGSGETKEEIGKCATLLYDDECYAGGDIIIFRPNTCNALFLGFVLNIPSIQTQKATKGQGDAVVHISTNSLQQLIVALPKDTDEQRAIAEVLSDIDSLIKATDKKIIKKRAIKEGAMQQLLTGRKRLSGFSKPWIEKKFYDLFNHRPAKNYQINTDAYNECGNFPIIDQGQNLIAGYTNDKSKIYSCSASGIIIFGDHTRIFKFINLDFAIGADGTQLLEVDSECNAKFIFYKCLLLELPDTGYNRHFKFLKEESFHIPPMKEEQQAIAQILTDMDDEIEQLEKQRAKYTVLKQGAMQKLLTGQLRLIAENKIDTKQVKHNNKINEAVVVSFLTNEFGTAKYPLSRFRYTKLAYLLHRKHEHIAEGYDKHAAGPYKSENRYSGAENIAIKNGYIQKVVNPLSGKDAFIAGNSIDEAKKYFVQWYGAEMKSWIAQFRYYKNEQLEVLATVDKSICDLSIQNTPISVKSIKEYIASIPQWKAKLEKPYFSDVEIKKAIAKSYCIFNNTIAL